jgi:hypothetical protein
MAFVEEEFPEEPIQVPLESLLYMVLNDYLHPSTRTEATMDGATFIVQEEFLHMVPDTHIRPNTSGVVTGISTAMDGATCIIQEDFPTTAPPPLNTVENPPILFSLEKLELIFDIRGYMVDQLHLDTLIINCIDLLFIAFSNTPTKQRCLTYTHSYVLKPVMTSFTMALRITGSMVLTTPLMFKSAQFFEHH